jgi:hypothetical protein
MSSLVRPELIDFLANIVRATHQERISWETTADQGVLAAPLEADLSLRLRLVEDFDKVQDEPDHVLSLLRGTARVFEVDRRQLDEEAVDSINQRARTEYPYAFDLFRDLWDRAILSTKRLPDEVSRATSILGKKLEDDIPF